MSEVEVWDGESDANITRAEAALAMRLAGASNADIAKELDFATPNDARQAYERALARAAKDYGDKERLRTVLNKQMERLMLVCYRRALNPNSPDQVTWARTFLAFADRTSKMNGLEQQNTNVIITPAYEEIVTWARKMHEEVSGHPIEIEADILSDEIVEAELDD